MAGPVEAEPAAKAPRPLTTNVAVSVVNVLAVVGSSLIAVPLLVDRLGLAGYGLWVLAQTLVIYVTTAENGFGPAIARFTSVAAHERRDVRPLLVFALLAYIAIGLLVVLSAHLLAGTLVDAFDVPARFHDDARATVGIVGWVTLAALVAAALGNTLSGLERFTTFTVTNVAGSLVWLGVLAFALGGDARLTDVGYAALAQWSVVAVLRLLGVRDVLLHRGRLLPGRALIWDLFRFSTRLQVAVAAQLVNTQTDRVVVGAVAPAATLGQVGIATQVADAGRFLISAPFLPLASRMAAAYGKDGTTGLDAVFGGVRRLWTVGALGVVAVGCGAMAPGIEAWIGDGHGEAAAYGVALLLAYGVSWLPAAAFAYLRALGRPRIEGNYGVATVVVNVASTIPLGIAFGAPGVVAATTVAYLAATAWVLRRLEREVPGGPLGGSPAVLVPACLGAAALAFLGGEALVAVLPRAVALAGMLALFAVDLAAYLAIALGTTPAGALRHLRRGAA